jgi:hypothetical protein
MGKPYIIKNIMPDKPKLKLSKESRFKPFPLARKALANRLYSTIEPDVYGDIETVKKKIGDFLEGTPRSTTQEQYSEDAWAKYLGLEQPGETISLSEHRPSVSKDKKAKYHRLPDEFEQLLLEGYEQNKSYIQSRSDDRTKMPMDETMMRGSAGRVLGQFTVGEGVDEETGKKYLSYYDKYDIAPNPAEGVVGKPFEFYNRIPLPEREKGGQLDNYIGLPEYGFGSWLKENAGGLLKGASSLVGLIPGVGQIAGPILNIAGSAIAGKQQQKADQAAADAEQARLDEIAAEQEAANKASNRAIREQNIVNTDQQAYASTFELGGELMGTDANSVPNIIEYSEKANSHGDGVGGVPVDAKGNPSVVSKSSAVGLTEAGEVTWEGYVFSDKLKLKK